MKEVKSMEQVNGRVLAQATKKMVRMYNVNGFSFMVMDYDMYENKDVASSVYAWLGNDWVELTRFDKVPTKFEGEWIADIADNYKDVLYDGKLERLETKKWYVWADSAGNECGRICKEGWHGNSFVTLQYKDGELVYTYHKLAPTTCAYLKDGVVRIIGRKPYMSIDITNKIEGDRVITPLCGWVPVYGKH